MPGQVNITEDKRVLSIQSHVTVGHVGNKSAAFPLQLLGFQFDSINTVSLSNHTASRYGRWGGSKTDAADLESIVTALDANGLLRQSHLLSGYVPSADSLLVVSQTVDRLREINPSLIYILDPVMGDEGRIYVSEAVIPVYKLLMKKATCATPNYFEAELLTEVKIIDLDSLRLSLKIFHERYSIPNIIISAVSLPATTLKKLGLTGANERMLVCVGSSIISSSGEPLETTSFAIAFPELAEHYEGVGDAFSSLVLARFPSLHPLPSDPIHPVSPLAGTAELAIASLQGIIAHTRVHALKLAGGRPEMLVGKPGEGAEERVRRLRMVELRLIQSQKEILDPVVTYHAVKL